MLWCFLLVFLLGIPVAQASPEASGQPVSGGRIIFSSLGEPSTLIPALATDTASHEVTEHLFVSLLRYNKDIEVEPWAASSYELLDEGRKLRFTLREDIYWEDGVQLTADDVEFTYKFMIDDNTPTAYGDDFRTVQSFTKTGKFSFEVTYASPFARLLPSWMQPIMPRHILEKEDLLTTSFARKPVGAGPYRFKHWESGSQLVLEASDTYFEGRPNIDEIVYRIIPDLATTFLELKAGRIDFMGLTPQQYLRQTNGPWWEEHWRKYRYISHSYTYLTYNPEHRAFKDERVRQAVAYAIDRQAIVDGVLLGQGIPALGPFIPGTWAHNDAITPYPHDPERARALLAEAGWKDRDGDGLLDKDGQPFSFTILTNQGNDQRIKSAILIQNQLKKLGIDVRIRTVEWAAFLKEFVYKGSFDAMILAWTVPQDPDSYTVWHSSRAPSEKNPHGLNFIHYKNPEVDALLEAARATADQAVRKPLYDRFQEILHKEQPYTFLYVPYALPVVQARFHGIEPAPAGIMYNFIRWWVPKNQQTYQVRP